jgi:hypothetical protein
MKAKPLQSPDGSDIALHLRGDDYIPEARWAKDKGISQHTSRRHRRHGLPFMKWGGLIWIGVRQGDAYLASLVRQHRKPWLPPEPFHTSNDPTPKPPRRRGARTERQAAEPP